MDDVIDITDYIKDFSLLVNNSLPEKIDEETFVWSFVPPQTQTVELSGTFKDVAGIFDIPKESNCVVKMTTKGQFWFDKKHEADVIMTNVNVGKDNSIEATYKSMATTDSTNYGFAARCLRWLLRR
jgi:hypothetical protein